MITLIRNVGKTIKINRFVEVEEKIVKQQISEITIRPDSKFIEVTINLINDSGQIVTSQSVIINQDNYDLIYSQSDLFDAGKQTGSFRESDLWKIIDTIVEDV
ncbi:hypothetical protein U8771_07735 [Enterococcus casseliflavus]|uniref:hypothetical protein n=1 Tax=Enterococcus casseliflavus TaxID=37734 RepID=UPI002D78FF45|nr:hypothetical protein [Enterococcus casseliflavus]WRO95865.1 hypothetical protein U8771_07735 [Enterococcus casseliflavus]